MTSAIAAARAARSRRRLALAAGAGAQERCRPALHVGRAEAPGASRRIIVGVDAGLAALRWAASQARDTHVPLVAVRSWALGRAPRRPPPAGQADVRHAHIVLSFDGNAAREGTP